jgi:heterodisulfide reductase subunit C
MMSLVNDIKVLSGQDVMLCFQCGECSSSCQMTGYKGFSPVKLIHSLQLDSEDVLKSRMYELCLHCFLCSVRCPQGLNFPDIATALSNIATRRYGPRKTEKILLDEIAGKGFVNPATFALKVLRVSILKHVGLRGLKMIPLLFKGGKIRKDLIEEVKELAKV